MRSGPIKYRGTTSTDYHKATTRKLVQAGVPQLPDDLLKVSRDGREPSDEQEDRGALAIAEACRAIRELYTVEPWQPEEESMEEETDG